MEIFPAIDLKNAQVVRLLQGDYDKVTVFSGDPVQVATGFYQSGAKNLHLVDLDGAKDGKLSNFDVIQKILQAVPLSVQVGGGIRDEQRIAAYLELGIRRVILGTIAAEDPGFVRRMVARYGDAIAVGVDAKNGKVAIQGWREVTDLDALEFCSMLSQEGVKTLIVTDIAKDGMMQGTNQKLYRDLTQRVTSNIIASGGVSTMQDLTELKQTNVWGAIIGKALYTGALKLEEVLTR